MTNFNFLSFFVLLVGLVFLAIAMASLPIHVKKKQDCLDLAGPNRINLFQEFYLNPNRVIYLLKYSPRYGLFRTPVKALLFAHKHYMWIKAL